MTLRNRGVDQTLPADEAGASDGASQLIHGQTMRSRMQFATPRSRAGTLPNNAPDGAWPEWSFVADLSVMGTLAEIGMMSLPRVARRSE